MLEILGYDGTTITLLDQEAVGEWLAQAGARLWLRGSALTEAELTWLKQYFSLSMGAKEEWPAAAAFLHPTPRFIIAQLPLPTGTPLRFWLGQSVLITQEEERLRPLDPLWQLYQTDLSRWPYGLDYLLYQLFTHLLPLTTNELNRLHSLGESSSLTAAPQVLAQGIHQMAHWQHNLSQWQQLTQALARLEHPWLDTNTAHQFAHLHQQITAHQQAAALTHTCLEHHLTQQTRQQTALYQRRLLWLTGLILLGLSLLLLTFWLTM
ncbi:MAG: hypothetical protein KJ063_05925 [Anaerolineae bacterium]|nr:hypothetical protein [Anaerolineae bacterium]